MKLAILTTHPIQYYAPVFRELTQMGALDVKVFYGWEGHTKSVIDPGFGKPIQWDIPLLEGYDYEFLRNKSKNPGSSRFWGIDCPEAMPRISNWNPDAILVYGWSYKTHLNAMKYFKGRIPVLFRGDSTMLDESPGPKRYLRRGILRWIFRYIDKAVYVGSNNRDYFLKHGLRPEQLHFAPHAIDNARFESDVPSQLVAASRLRAELGISDQEHFWLFSGKLETKKAPDLLLHAFQELGASNVHLGFVGSGEMESELSARAVPNVHFLGFRNQKEMPSVYRASDLLVLPSRGPGETWGLAINEAMACGLPILCSNKVGAAVDLVKTNNNGWVFQSNHKNELMKMLSEISRLKKESLRKMGKNSTDIISDWTIQRQAALIVEAAFAI